MDLATRKRWIKYYIQVILSVYLFLLIVIFPYYAPLGYVKLGTYKFIFFRETGIQCLLMVFPAVLFLLICQWKQLAWKQLSVTDKAMLSYAAAVILSYIYTEWKDVAFWGAERWFMGLASQMMFAAIYFMVSRYSEKVEVWYVMLLAASSGVFLIGLLNRFSIYPFGMNPDEPTYFISTLGNINWFCGYWSVVFPIGLVLYWDGMCGKLWTKLLLTFYVVLGYMAGIVQGSSSGFLALGSVLLVLFIMSFQESDRLLRWLELLMIMAGSSLIISIVKWAFPMALNYENEIEEWLTQFAVCGLLLGGGAVCYVIARYLLKRKHCSVRTLAAGIFLAMVLIAIMTCYWNIVHSNMGNITSVFVFNMHWGNGRGAAWIAGGMAFETMSFVQKLVGVGPDCFERYVYSNPDIASILYSVFGTSSLANTHNELFMVLINTGVCGFLSYVAIFLTAMVRHFRGKGLEMVSAVCILAYTVHNMVSFQQVVSTPIVFIMMGFGESIFRKNSSEKTKFSPLVYALHCR